MGRVVTGRIVRYIDRYIERNIKILKNDNGFKNTSNKFIIDYGRIELDM